MTASVTVRVDARLVERADALVGSVAESSGRAATRADVWREALVRGLRELERAAAAAPEPSRR